MLQHMLKIGCVAVALLLPEAAWPQAPSSESMAAAKELVTTIRAADQFKAILPGIVQHLKPAIVQGRPQVEKDFDALMPILVEAVNSRLGAITDMMADVYARNFTVAEIKDITAFYHTATGQKVVEKTPAITQQSLAAGQQFAALLVQELKDRIVNELRKKGHKI